MKNKIRRIFFTLTSSVFMSIPVHIIRHLYLKMFIKDMGNNVYIGKHLDIKSPENIIIGNNVIINKRVLLDGRRDIRIGNNVDIAQDVAVWTEQHDYDNKHQLVGGPVVIEDYCWLCFRSTILPNVTISKGVVVACSAVVCKSVDELLVVGGIPARMIRKRSGLLDINLIYKPRFWDQN